MRPRAAPLRSYSTAPTHAPFTQSRIRCYAIPVMKDSWAFYPDTHHHSQELFTGHRLTGRLARLADTAKHEWDQCVHAPPGTLRHRFYAGSQLLISRLDPREALCKALLPAHSEATSAAKSPMEESSLTIVYPASMPEQAVRQAFLETLAQRATRHSLMKVLSTAGLPVTLAMGLLPGPNVFFAWNLFRLWSHYKAEKGAKHGLSLAGVLDMQSSTELERLVHTEERAVSPISDEALDRIQQHFDLPGFVPYLQRTRDRLLKERPRPR